MPAYTFSRLPMREKAFRVNISVQFIVDDRCEVAGAARFQHRVEISCSRDSQSSSRVPRIFHPILAKLFDLSVLKHICGSRDFKEHQASARRAKTAPKWSKWRNWFMRTSWKVRALIAGTSTVWHVASIDSYLLRRFPSSKQSIKTEPLESAMRFISA